MGGQEDADPQEEIQQAEDDIARAKKEEKLLQATEEEKDEEKEQQGGFSFKDLKGHASRLTKNIKNKTKGLRATLKKRSAALIKKSPVSASKLPRSNYLLWLGAGMSRIAYNSPLMMYAMLDALVSDEGNQCLGKRFKSLRQAINAQGGNPFDMSSPLQGNGCAGGNPSSLYNWTQQEMSDATNFINNKFDDTFASYLVTPPTASEYRSTKDNKLNRAFWDFSSFKQNVQSKVLQTAHYKVVYLHTSEDLSCYIIASKLNNSIFIVYRGSRSLKNWKTNFTMMAKNNADYDPCADNYQLYANPNIKLFPGFLKRDMEAMHTTTMMAAYLAKDFLGAGPQNKAKVFTFGHSLGGALCSIYALLYSIIMNPLVGTHQMPELANFLENRITCVSYGAPRVFNTAANTLFNAQQQAKHIYFRRVWTKGDPVQRLPVGLYVHPGTKQEDIVFPITRTNTFATIMSLGTASHLEEEGISYMGLVSTRMNTLRSELKQANPACKLSLLLTMVLGPPKMNTLPVLSMVGYLPEYSMGSKNTDVDISSDKALFRDIVSQLKKVTQGSIRMEESTPSLDKGVVCKCTTGLCSYAAQQAAAIPPTTSGFQPTMKNLPPQEKRDDSIFRINCVPRTTARQGIIADRSKASVKAARLLAIEAADKTRNISTKVATAVFPTKMKDRLITLAQAARAKGGQAAKIVGSGIAGTTALLADIATSPAVIIGQLGSPAQAAMSVNMNTNGQQFLAFDLVLNSLGSLIGSLTGGKRRTRKNRKARNITRRRR